MNNHKKILIYILLTLSMPAAAFVGSIEEAQQAALNNQIPAYLVLLQEKINDQKNNLERKLGVKNPQEKLAWDYVQQAIIKITYSSMKKAIISALDKDIPKSAEMTSWKNLVKIIDTNNSAYSQAQSLGELLLWGNMFFSVFQFLEHYSAGEPSDSVVEKSIFRVAELAALNQLLTLEESLIAPVYAAALREL